jgi:hypothetical protein
MIKQVLIKLNPYIALFPYQKQSSDISYKDGCDGMIKRYSWLIFSIDVTIKYKKCK